MSKKKHNKSQKKQSSSHKSKAPQIIPAADRRDPLLIAQEAILKAQFAKERAAAEARYLAQLNILMQFSEDACLMATADVRGLGPANAEALRIKFREVLNEMSAMLADDEDKEIVYGRAKIDQRLVQIEGKDRAKPWDERLAWCLAPVEVKANEKSNQSESNPAEVS